MKVIFQRDIPKVAKSGDIKDVADGYARNYLFPRGFALAATGGALKEHNSRLEREKNRDARMLSSAQSDAQTLEGLSLTILAKVGNGTKLYGSITPQDLVDEIKKKSGVTVDKRRVGLADPIRILGSYNIPVRLHSEVNVSIALDVLTQEQLDKRIAAEAAAVAAAQVAAESAKQAEITPAEVDTSDAADGASEESAGEV